MNKIQREFLTNEQLIEQVPVVAATSPTRNVSDKYVTVNTLTVVQDLEKFGWRVVKASHRGDGSSKFSKHSVIMEHPDVVFEINSDVIYPRILISNSHDGLSSFRFNIGLFRLVCKNGVVIPAKLFGQEFNSSFKIRHMHYGFERLRETLRKVTENMQLSFSLIERLMERELTDGEKQLFAKRAYLSRSSVKRSDVEKMLASVPQETVADLLGVERVEDEGNTAWAVFNRVQEKVISGGFRYGDQDREKMYTAREISGFERVNKVNMELFEDLVEVIGESVN